MNRILSALALLVFAACATTPAAFNPNGEIVDLTHAFTEQTLYWPNSPSGFKLTELAYGPTPGGFFYSSYAYSAPEHGGTHLDAPIHFSEQGITVDAIPLR